MRRMIIMSMRMRAWIYLKKKRRGLMMMRKKKRMWNRMKRSFKKLKKV
jgi:hypothetical protein